MTAAVGDLIPIGAVGNAATAEVLATKTFSSQTAGVNKAGTMPNNGAVTITPSDADLTIAQGYHNGQGKVSAVAVPVDKVLTGTTIAGQAGTMANRGAVTITPSGADQAIAAGYHNGSGKVSAVVVPVAKVLNDTTIAGQQGTMADNGAQNKTLTITGNGAATASIPAGYTTGGTATASLSAGLAPSILSGTTIGGVAGTAKTAVAGEVLIASADTQRGVTSETSVKVKEFRVNYKGVYRIKYTLWSSTTNKLAVAAVRTNGANPTILGTNQTATPIERSDDLSLNAGDTCELWLNAEAGSAGAYVSNFRIYADMSLATQTLD